MDIQKTIQVLEDLVYEDINREDYWKAVKDAKVLIKELKQECDTANVVGQSGQLLAFCEWLSERDFTCDMTSPQDWVEMYLKSKLVDHKTKSKNITMKKQKTIYDLDLHESVMVKVDVTDGRGYPCEWQVTRVASGWLYQDQNPRRTTLSEFFVPFDNRFQNVPY